MCNQNRKQGRPYVYKERKKVEISLPIKAITIADELRGKQQLAPFITELICKNLGLKEDEIYVK